MGTFLFKWEHPAAEVYVTGTFDDWSKSEKLEKKGDVFEKNVTLPASAGAQEKIYYKFVVDGNWVTDHTAPQENDASGNLNNVLTQDRIVKPTPATVGIMSGVTPTSTTAGLAKDVPLEKDRPSSSGLPGTFPETPAAGEQEVSVNPLPAAAGAVNPIKLAPGEKVPDPASFTTNTVTSGVHDDPELVAADKKAQDQTFGVAPLPAFPGAVNPVTLPAGAPVPDPQTLTGTNATSVAPTIQSAGPQSTTAQLAANVPLESAKVPDVVKQSQREAGVSPEASAVPSEVKDKSAVENELLNSTPVAPATAEGTAGSSAGASKTATAAATGAAVAAGGAVAAAAYSSGVADKLPASVQQPLNDMQTKAKAQEIAYDTPDVVKHSIAESGSAPEAASNEQAVLEKKAVENELLHEVKPSTATGEPAPQPSAGGLSTGQRPASREVSPHTKPDSQQTPQVTTGVDSSKTDPVTRAAAPATPAKDTTDARPASGSKATESPASATDKKKKRSSIFGKIKAKFSDKDKDKH